MQSKARTVAEYLATLPEGRREAVEAVRAVILKNLDKDYEEGMQYGMIGYYVPHRAYPSGYHCDPKQPLPFASLASQKNFFAVYLMSIYSDPDELAWFQAAWGRTGKKLNMGKSCVRFKRIEDVALEVVGEAIRRMPAKKYIAQYESVLAATKRRPVKKLAKAERPVKAGKAAKSSKKISKRARTGR